MTYRLGLLPGTRLALRSARNAIPRRFSTSRKLHAKLAKAKPATTISSIRSTKPAGAPGKDAPQLQEWVTIYRPSAVTTAAAGWVRLCPWVLYLVWVGSTCSSLLASPDFDDWLIIPLASAVLVPVVAVAVITRGHVSSVRLQLPPRARWDRKYLLEWAKDMPPNTRLQFDILKLTGFRSRAFAYELQDISLFGAKWKGYLKNINREKYHAPDRPGLWHRMLSRLRRPSEMLRVGAKDGAKSKKRVPVPELWELVLDHVRRRGAG